MGTTLVSETKWNLVETDVHEVGIMLSSKTEWMVSRTWNARDHININWVSAEGSGIVIG